jgi:hypothetical protein
MKYKGGSETKRDTKDEEEKGKRSSQSPFMGNAPKVI